MVDSRQVGGLSTWWRLGRDGWRAVLKSTAAQFKADQVPNLAALVTLRLVLALVPSLIAAVAIIAQVTSPADIERLVIAAEEFIPEQSREFVVDTLDNILDDDSGGWASVIGVVVGLFAASSAAAALVKALNTAYGAGEGRGFVGQRLVSLAIVAAVVVTLAGMFLALVLGPSLMAWLLPEVLLDSPIRYLITIGRYMAAATLLALFFGLTFRLGPDRDQRRLHPLTPGAVLGVSGWLLLSYVFSLYIRIAGNFAVYGAAAGVVILLIWMNYSFTVLLMGAELDHEIERYVAAADPAASRHGTPAGPDPAEVEADAPDQARARR